MCKTVQLCSRFSFHSGSSNLAPTAKPGHFPICSVRTTVPTEHNCKPAQSSLKPGRFISSQTSSPNPGRNEEEQSTKMPVSLMSRVKPRTSRSVPSSDQRTRTGAVSLNRGCALREGNSWISSIDNIWSGCKLASLQAEGIGGRPAGQLKPERIDAASVLAEEITEEF